MGKPVGHGVGDYLELYRLIEAVRSGIEPDIDVYDATTWSVITDLTGKFALIITLLEHSFAN